jgi:hypothetical protein
MDQIVCLHRRTACIAVVVMPRREVWSDPLNLSGTIIRGTLKTSNSQLVTPISIKLQRTDGYD